MSLESILRKMLKEELDLAFARHGEQPEAAYAENLLVDVVLAGERGVERF